jgi:hypothetical protein
VPFKFAGHPGKVTIDIKAQDKGDGCRGELRNPPIFTRHGDA